MTISKAPIIYIVWAIGCRLVHTQTHTQCFISNANFIRRFRRMSSTPEKRHSSYKNKAKNREREIPFPFSSVQIIHQIKINVKIKWNIFYFFCCFSGFFRSIFFFLRYKPHHGVFVYMRRVLYILCQIASFSIFLSKKQ